MNVFAITNQKGGCGKTTTATNLAFAFAQQIKKTLLIDLDPQAHATMGLGLHGVSVEKSVYSIFKNHKLVELKISDLAVKIDNLVDIIPGHIVVSTVEHDLKDKENGLLILFKVLMREELDYDVIIIDCPPNLGFLTFNAIRAATQIIVPVEPSTFALMGVYKLLSMTELIKLKLHHSPSVKGLVTMYDPFAEFSKKMLFKIQNMFKNKLYSTIINYDIAFKEAQENLVSIFKHNKDSKGARDYANLADEILNNNTEDDSQEIYDELQQILYSNVFAKEKEFSYKAPRAKEVFIVGDFNNWKLSETAKLLKTEEGRWEKKLFLPPGKYKYKYVVDGLYYADPQNPTKEPNPYGSYDSVCEI